MALKHFYLENQLIEEEVIQPFGEGGTMLRGHEIALWSGVASFFASLLAVGIFDVINPEQWVEYVGALAIAFITAGSVYAKQRLDDAKREEKESM